VGGKLDKQRKLVGESMVFRMVHKSSGGCNARQRLNLVCKRKRKRVGRFQSCEEGVKKRTKQGSKVNLLFRKRINRPKGRASKAASPHVGITNEWDV